METTFKDKPATVVESLSEVSIGDIIGRILPPPHIVNNYKKGDTLPENVVLSPANWGPSPDEVFCFTDEQYEEALKYIEENTCYER